MRLDSHYVGGARVWCDGTTPLRTVTRIDGRRSPVDGALLWPHRYEIHLQGADADWRLTLDADAATLWADTKVHHLAGGHAVLLASDTARVLREALEMLGVACHAA